MINPTSLNICLILEDGQEYTVGDQSTHRFIARKQHFQVILESCYARRQPLRQQYLERFTQWHFFYSPAAYCPVSAFAPPRITQQDTWTSQEGRLEVSGEFSSEQGETAGRCLYQSLVVCESGRWGRRRRRSAYWFAGPFSRRTSTGVFCSGSSVRARREFRSINSIRFTTSKFRSSLFFGSVFKFSSVSADKFIIN